MTAPLSSAVLWRLNTNRAEFQLDSWTGSVDLTRPERGVEVNESSTIRPSGAQVLGIEVGQHAALLGTPVDVYVRDADLVARYAESANFPFGIQTYWSLATREISGGSALQIDLLISIQTPQLGVHARVGCSSRIAISAAWQGALENTAAQSRGAELIAASTSRLLGEQGAPWILSELARPGEQAAVGSYFEATLPNDFLGADLELSAGSLAIRRQMLDETMEKGVIRRLSCRGIFVLGPVGPEVARTLFEELFSEKPRLTT